MQCRGFERGTVLEVSLGSYLRRWTVERYASAEKTMHAIRSHAAGGATHQISLMLSNRDAPRGCEGPAITVASVYL